MSAPAVGPDWGRMIEARRQLVLKAARERFHRFGPTVVRDAAEGKPIEYSHLHLAWIAHVSYAWSRGLHAGIFSHFGSGKSSGFGVPLITYLVGRDPQERVKIVCSGDGHASQRLQSCRKIIESPAYGQVFPGVERGEKWNDHMLYAERVGHGIDPTLESRGVYSKGTGGRATTILFDDVVDIENCTTYEKRKRVKHQVETLWMSRLEPRGKVLWIATPWDLDDASYTMRSRGDFVWLEQRVKEDLTGYEQEVYNAGSDYRGEVAAMMADMLVDGQ